MRVGLDCSPVALFVYKRPDHAKRTLEHLAANTLARKTDLHVFSDGPRDPLAVAGVASTRALLRGIEGFASVSVTEHPENLGLAQSIVLGVSAIVRTHGRVIVLEDDMITSPFFLEYMNDALDLYATEDRVASVHAYLPRLGQQLPETFFLRGADCWGWGTWARAWQHYLPDGRFLLGELRRRGLEGSFDLGGAFAYTRMLEAQVEGKNDSWAIRWHASAFLRGMLSLHPSRSLIQNIGRDGSGTHGESSEKMTTDLTRTPILVRRSPVVHSSLAEAAFREFHLLGRREGNVLRVAGRWAAGLLRRISRPSP